MCSMRRNSRDHVFKIGLLGGWMVSDDRPWGFSCKNGTENHRCLSDEEKAFTLFTLTSQVKYL